MIYARLLEALGRQNAAPTATRPNPANPYARIARAMSGSPRQRRGRVLEASGPGPTERAQHESSGYADSYGGLPGNSGNGYQSSGYDNDSFQV